MNANCYVCDECFELFEQRASMGKSNKFSRDHRVRCPTCDSDATRQAVPGSRSPGYPEDKGVCQARPRGSEQAS